MMDCDPVLAIRSWKVQYYKNLRKRWIYGQLCINPRFIVFNESDHGSSSSSSDSQTIQSTLDDSAVLIIKYEQITDVKKTTTSFVYSALTITVGSESHWFSALPSRESAFNTIQHFWRERLIPSVPKTGVDPRNQTRIGQELLGIAQNSSVTLKETGTLLYHQGEQLDHATSVMYDLHNDLDVAENLLTGLESWVGKWSTSSSAGDVEPFEVAGGNIPVVIEVPMVYQRLGAGAHKQYQGRLRISPEGATIQDSVWNVVHHFNPRDISCIKVPTPWEMIFIRYMLGEPDISYSIISTQLLDVIKLVDSKYRTKIQYDDPPEFVEKTRPLKNIGVSEGSVDHLISSPSGVETPPPPQQQLLMDDSQQAVSEAEAQEIISTIAEMKAMAIDINKEQDRQKETIEHLTDRVDRADMRLGGATWRTKQLL